jgi:hypothetical protein
VSQRIWRKGEASYSTSPGLHSRNRNNDKRHEARWGAQPQPNIPPGHRDPPDGGPDNRARSRQPRREENLKRGRPVEPSPLCREGERIHSYRASLLCGSNNIVQKITHRSTPGRGGEGATLYCLERRALYPLTSVGAPRGPSRRQAYKPVGGRRQNKTKKRPLGGGAISHEAPFA